MAGLKDKKSAQSLALAMVVQLVWRGACLSVCSMADKLGILWGVVMADRKENHLVETMAGQKEQQTVVQLVDAKGDCLAPQMVAKKAHWMVDSKVGETVVQMEYWRVSTAAEMTVGVMVELKGFLTVVATAVDWVLLLAVLTADWWEIAMVATWVA